ncbi:phosphoribosylamine--glycine ligase [Candidatus Pelagibacter communis]|uniref:phosphoribosylamine--glycine ligase n=1 Tax=Pelagibacter ubique TaxID=198252 RepID=UPI00094C6DA7|nr:phosphoribosylamine--glycine ligase [Candidatus Pelagibacter ubique]
MNVGIIGSGGREHAICYLLNKSKKVSKIFCFPGNAGTNLIAQNVNLNTDNFPELERYCLRKDIKMLVVGPEKPLVNGIVDHFKGKSIRVFGPDKISSKLEGSKIFTKKICQKKNIPTSKFKICENLTETIDYLKNSYFPIVIKADGLASGKGVYICKNFNEAKVAAKEIFNGKFGFAEQILIEEFLDGEEMSYFIVTDGKNYKFFGSAQDHKRVGEGDTGKNTGGMGCYSPSRLLNDALELKIKKKIIEPTLNAINEHGGVYKGFLYIGLMIKNDEPFLIEFNVRMGDPECQTILPTLNTDLMNIFISCCDGTLNQSKINFSKFKSICIVLCSKGYPEKFDNNIEIEDLEQLKLLENQNIFHAGTLKTKTGIISNGGRVLSFVSTSDDFLKCRNEAINLIKKLNWKNGYFRADIGNKVIKI